MVGFSSFMPKAHSNHHPKQPREEKEFVGWGENAVTYMFPIELKNCKCGAFPTNPKAM
jgi:hypothetical protein